MNGQNFETHDENDVKNTENIGGAANAADVVNAADAANEANAQDDVNAENAENAANVQDAANDHNGNGQGSTGRKRPTRNRRMLFVYDLIILILVGYFLLLAYGGNEDLSVRDAVLHIGLMGACVFLARFTGKIYRQIWRYGGIQCYIRLLVADLFAGILYLILERILPIRGITFARLLSLVSINLLLSLAMRMMYRYAYKCRNNVTFRGKCLSLLLYLFTGIKDEPEKKENPPIKAAIIGAGRVGVSLAEELLGNKSSEYRPKCFIEIDKAKIGREIHGLPVLSEEEASLKRLRDMEITEIIFAIPGMDAERRKHLYMSYRDLGFSMKVYDYPIMQSAKGGRHLREFDIEEILFRKEVDISSDCLLPYYKDQVILITGGGGSIGSELARQLASLSPKQIILLDIYENGVYDVQQELRLTYRHSLNLAIEICSITDRDALERVFEAYHPQIIINAAAHKHVPLMEHNCIEAIRNNIFGTLNLVELCEQYHAKRFMMVSTDKAVNPTNVMGATKRMCEIIVQSASTYGSVNYSATRFGNVLGSAGSVIPLFRRQIANGGPVTITDKRIIRYFMTIPEAAQLVLTSGAMAKNGELFVLDMGRPVKILELAQNMIRLSGARNIEIVEIGLRPGEKLYEELLVKTEDLDKTENSMIFIERDAPLSRDEVASKLDALRKACESGDEEAARAALHEAVPAFRTPEEVNGKAELQL